MEGKRKRHTSVVSGNEKGLWLQIETETMENHGNGHVILEPIFYTCGKKKPTKLDNTTSVQETTNVSSKSFPKPNV
jgi:hypothetical protein